MTLWKNSLTPIKEGKIMSTVEVRPSKPSQEPKAQEAKTVEESKAAEPSQESKAPEPSEKPSQEPKAPERKAASDKTKEALQQILSPLIQVELLPILQLMEKMESGLVAVQSAVAALDTALAEVKTEIAGFKNDLAGFKIELAGFKIDIANFKKETAASIAVDFMTYKKELTASMASTKKEMDIAIAGINLALKQVEERLVEKINIIASGSAENFVLLEGKLSKFIKHLQSFDL